MARLIRTEKEVEGRFEEVWIVVEEDPLEQWPAGPLAVVGRPAPRQDAPLRVRGEARYTADIKLPGMLHAAVLRSPHAHARVKRINLAPALALPGVRAAIGPGEAHTFRVVERLSVQSLGAAGLEEEAGYAGAAVAAVAADTFAQACAGVEAIEIEWEELEVVLDPDEAVRRELLTDEPRRSERGDVEQALAEADVVVEGTYRTQTVLHNSLETHQAVCEWQGDTLHVYISTQFIWGVRQAVAETLGMPEDKVRVVCEFMGGGFGSKNSPDSHTFIAAELAKRTGRPVRCALTRREENTSAGNRNATIQRLRAGARSDGTIVAFDGEFTNSVGWSGWSASTEGPMRMLYDCENVRTVTYGARLNTPPMKAFRAPGFVEGTFGLECLIDELAARLDVDPLELRRRNYASSNLGTPFSSKNLEECYRRAEPHWERRHEVRARSDAVWKRGVGMASQIWYGGGGPPSYAWVRLGSHGRAAVITAMQDIGTGTRTAMAQIAAEELGLPLEHVEVVLGDSARGPYASISAGSSTLPSMGPAVRAAAADAKRQVIEIAAQRYDLEERVLDIRDGVIVSSDDNLSVPLEEVVGVLDEAQILGKGARGPNPTGMSVLTFGVHVVEVAVDVETGEVQVERVAAIHDVGRIVNPLGASSQVEGGIIQGIGHTLSEERLLDPETGRVLTTSLDSYRMPTIADVPEIVCEFVDRPDEHLTNLGSKGLGEPPIVPAARPRAAGGSAASRRSSRSRPRSRTRSATRPVPTCTSCRSPARRCCARCARPRRANRSARRRSVELLRPSSVEELDGGVFLHGGSEVVPLLREGLLDADRLVDVRGVVPRGVQDGVIGAGTTLAELEVEPTIPDALREACRLAASPQLRNVSSLGGNLLQATRCWYWRLGYRCRLHGGDRCHASEGEHREHAIFANGFCASAHPSDVAAALVALGAQLRTSRRELAVEELYRVPDEGNRSTTTLGDGELLLEAELPPVEASVYLKAMDRKRWSFPQVGVAAVRHADGSTRIALAGVAPTPWRIESADELDSATPLPRTEWKVQLGRALVRRALARLA